MKCKEHPDAPHGFLRNVSNVMGRYVCECESWEPQLEHCEWVGLTDDEIMEVNGIHDDPEEWPEVISEARAIEAKLKEKNT